MRRWAAALIAMPLLTSSLYANRPAGAGLDLILLVDRSRSMAGQPLELVPSLAADLVMRNAAANRVVHRLGIVSFGARARVDVPLTSSEDPALRARVQLATPFESGAHTDVLAAFRAAAEMFRTRPSEAERRRAIVVITDGDLNWPGARASNRELALTAFVSSNLQDVTVDVLLLPGCDAARERFWRRLSAGRAHTLARGAESVLAAVHGTVTSLAGTMTIASNPIAGAETIFVPPYLDVIVFDVLRGSADSTVSLFPPNSSTAVIEGASGIEVIRAGHLLTTIVVNRPQAGRWRFEKSRADARVRVQAQQFFPRGVLVVPSAVDRVRQRDAVTFVYRVMDSAERPLNELAQYPLALELVLTLPDGTQSASVMERRADLGRGVFAAAGPRECSMAGRYWTEVRVRTRGPAAPLEIFRDRWSGFTVTPAASPAARAAVVPRLKVFAVLLLATALGVLLLASLWR